MLVAGAERTDARLLRFDLLDPDDDPVARQGVLSELSHIIRITISPVVVKNISGDPSPSQPPLPGKVGNLRENINFDRRGLL